MNASFKNTGYADWGHAALLAVFTLTALMALSLLG